MALSPSELYEAGMNLPPSVRKDVALRLLESLEVTDDQDAIDDAWATEISARVDDVLNGTVETIPGDDVFARIAQHLDAREAAREA